MSTEAQPHGGRLPDEEYLDDVIAGMLVLGEWPTSNQYDTYSTHAHNTCRARFGSWPETIEAAKERWERTKGDWIEIIGEEPQLPE